MAQYLLKIKSILDSLATAGASIDSEDIIHHTLNGLPALYQAFKTAICTNLQPLSLDDLYTILCSEELNLAHEVTRNLSSLQLIGQSIALAAPRARGRGRSNSFCGRSSSSSRPLQSSVPSTRGGRIPRLPVTCQIVVNWAIQQLSVGIAMILNIIPNNLLLCSRQILLSIRLNGTWIVELLLILRRIPATFKILNLIMVLVKSSWEMAKLFLYKILVKGFFPPLQVICSFPLSTMFRISLLTYFQFIVLLLITHVTFPFPLLVISLRTGRHNSFFFRVRVLTGFILFVFSNQLLYLLFISHFSPFKLFLISSTAGWVIRQLLRYLV
ncbi:hypothetical protein MA16_Dca020488 [Dendrobium catenatum]|uniref:Retrovirus-related Pol polyprotein from transposon TNT 1-94 n=1 Tax=Dendrobium catenatum TaxID=906689 RepID=A0A2I0WIE7_9ASPA|nr:hypothetical protein MA16_Dca020488 [Dendrobium catenatum]